MLETVDLSLSLTKEVYKKKAPPLREKLRLLQYECKDAEIPIVVVVEGWDASGKGGVISRLLERIDPRGFKVHPARPPTTEEEAKPFLWRYWVRLPQDGEIALFDRSWYGRVMIERVAKMVPKKVWGRAFEEINQFERQLAEDGAVIVKFFLHISKKEQRRRLKKLAKDKFERWRVTKWDWKHHKDYDKYVKAIEEMVAKINEFEWQLSNFGTVVVKFWLHIDQEEQLRRFNGRELDPFRSYKLTDEDWRNRAKWNDYRNAVEEMIEKTSTAWAPWTVVEANDKFYARVKVVQTLTKALEAV